MEKILIDVSNHIDQAMYGIEQIKNQNNSAVAMNIYATLYDAQSSIERFRTELLRPTK